MSALYVIVIQRYMSDASNKKAFNIIHNNKCQLAERPNIS